VTFEELASRGIDTLLVPGAVEVDSRRRVRAVSDPTVVHWVKTLSGNARRIASVCVGAHILADAGLLDGKRATTHWSTAQQLAAEHPAIEVDADPIFIRDENVWTGAGLTACSIWRSPWSPRISGMRWRCGWLASSSCISSGPVGRVSSVCLWSRCRPRGASMSCGTSSPEISRAGSPSPILPPKRI